MTCIVGVEHNGSVYLGADSAASDNHRIIPTSEPKVFHNYNNKKFVFGYSGSFRFGQLLQYSFSPPKQTVKNDFQYLVTEFMDSFRETLKKGGILKTTDGHVDNGGYFLLGYNGKLYLSERDFHIRRAHFGYESIGSGADHAMAVLHYLKDSKIAPKTKLLNALNVSSELITTVCPPFNFIKV